MKRLGLAMIFLLATVFSSGLPVEAHNNHQHEPPPKAKPRDSGKPHNSELQLLVDATEPGGVLQLEGRAYRGSITIDKPITIVGTEGTIIESYSTAFTIQDSNSIYFKDFGIEAEVAAVFADNVDALTMENITIEKTVAGIQVTNSENLRFHNVDMTGKMGHFADKGHAVALYKSKFVTITDSDMREVMDGFYFESTEHIRATNNTVNDSRYGFHMMYSEDIAFTNNQVAQNLTGFMVMTSQNVHIENNDIAKNNTLNSLGVYLYDVDDVAFTQNTVRENTTAMDIQNVRTTTVTQNDFLTNGTVLQAKKSATLVVTDNEFHANILAVRADEQGVELRHNFYDDYEGDDFNGDGIGDTSYIATNSFGQWMVRKPVYQYFVESPSVVTLNMMDTEVTGDNDLVLEDVEPIIVEKHTDLKVDIQQSQLLWSSVILLIILAIRRVLK